MLNFILSWYVCCYWYLLVFRSFNVFGYKSYYWIHQLKGEINHKNHNYYIYHPDGKNVAQCIYHLNFLFYTYQNSFFRLRLKYFYLLFHSWFQLILDVWKAVCNMCCNTALFSLWLFSFLIWLLLCEKKKKKVEVGIVVSSLIMTICFANNSFLPCCFLCLSAYPCFSSTL